MSLAPAKPETWTTKTCPSRRRPFRRVGCLLPALFLGACASKNYEAKSDVRTSFTINEKVWGDAENGQGDDSDKIKEKIVNSGWVKDEDGNMVARNSDLYSGKKVGRGKDIKKKDAYLSKRETDKKYFQTPEYLERQKFATKSVDDRENAAREGLFDKNRPRESGLSARTDAKPGFFESLNPFKTTSARETGSTFATRQNAAQGNSTYARGTSHTEIGGYSDRVNTLDDVKKLLHPEAFD